MLVSREKFLSSLEDGDREALAKVFDRAAASLKSGRCTFTPFLSEREFSEVQKRKKHLGEADFSAFGGYDGAARVMLRFGGEDEFPITAVKFSWQGGKLRHGDILGAALSLGTDRSRIGDIVISDAEAVVFAESSIADFLRDNLTNAGGEYLTGETADAASLKIERRYENITGTVMQLRADSVLSVFLKTSRSKAAECISSQRFYLNQALCTKCDREIKENDIISVRGFGKGVVSGASVQTKKGRIYITIKKYV